jgi:hypothetical protein
MNDKEQLDLYGPNQRGLSEAASGNIAALDR